MFGWGGINLRDYKVVDWSGVHYGGQLKFYRQFLPNNMVQRSKLRAQGNQTTQFEILYFAVGL